MEEQCNNISQDSESDSEGKGRISFLSRSENNNKIDVLTRNNNYKLNRLFNNCADMLVRNSTNLDYAEHKSL